MPYAEHPIADSASTRTLARRALLAQIRKFETRKSGLWLLPEIRDAFDAKLGRHFHLFPELFVQVRGCSVMRFPRESLTLRSGAVLLAPRGMPHEEFIGGRSRAFCNLVFMYSGRHVHAHVGQRLGNHPHPRGVREETLLCEPADDPGRYLNDIATLSQSDSPHAATAIRGLFLAHFACLLEGLSAPAPARDGESGKIVQCRRFINQRLADPQLSVKTLARWIGCSPDYLSHCFHGETGVRLSRFIHAQRIRQAQSLLTGSAMNISEIALSCGYRDPGHFTRVFRELTGRAPLKWRKKEG